MQVFGESLGLEAAEQARRIEEQGYDGLVAVDHFFSARAASPPRWRVQPLVALGAAAAATSRITLAAMVMNVNFHHPAVIAHAIASLDQLSKGRAELGLGSGWYRPEHIAFGLPWGSPAARTERLLEAARVCRAMLENKGAVSHHGAHFQVDNHVAWEWDTSTRPVPVVIGGSRKELLVRAAEVANRVDLLEAKDQSRSAETTEALLRSIRDHAAAANNPLRVSATITATAGGGSARLFDRIKTLHELGVDRIHVIPGGPEPRRTLAAVGEMLPDIHRL